MSMWNKVKTTQLENLTQTQIKSLIGSNYLSEEESLAEGVLIHNAKLASSTFGNGGTIPSTGSIESSTFTDSITAIQPSTGEVWIMDPSLFQVTNNGLAPVSITVSLTDGTTTMNFPPVQVLPGLSAFVLGVDSTASIQSYAMRLTNTLYFQLIADVDQTHTYFMPITKEAF